MATSSSTSNVCPSELISLICRRFERGRRERCCFFERRLFGFFACARGRARAHKPSMRARGRDVRQGAQYTPRGGAPWSPSLLVLAERFDPVAPPPPSRCSLFSRLGALCVCVALACVGACVCVALRGSDACACVGVRGSEEQARQQHKKRASARARRRRRRRDRSTPPRRPAPRPTTTKKTQRPPYTKNNNSKSNHNPTQ